MSFVRNTSMTVAARYVAIAAKAAAALIVATSLGAAGAGTFALVRVLPHVGAALLGLGMSIATPYLIGSRRYAVQAITENTVAIGLLLSAVGWTVWLLLSGVLHGRFYTELPASSVLVVGAALPLLLLRNYLNSIQQGLQTFKGANLVLCAEEFATLAVLLPLLWSGNPFEGSTLIVASAIAGAGTSFAMAAGLLVHKGVWPLPRLHREIAYESMRFGLRGHVGRMANMLNWRLDTVILSALASVEVVGYYSVASQVAEFFRPLSQSLTFVLRPLIASVSVVEAKLRGVTLYRRIFALNLLLIALMGVAGGRLIETLFGAEFSAAVPAFHILLIGLAAHGANGVLAGYNVGVGRPEFNTYTALAGLAVTVVADVALIPPYGLIGAAVASSIAYSVKAITLMVLFLSSTGVSFAQLIGVKEYSPDAA